MALKAKHGGYAAIVVALVSTSEGVRQYAYPDPATRGKPWTVCYGETKGVKRGDHHSLAECRAMLERDLVVYAKGVEACTKRKGTDGTLPDGPKAAFVDFAYNIGVGGYCRSSVRRLWDEGDRRGACNALLKYNRAAGIVFPGLTYRRERERGFCLEGRAMIAAFVLATFGLGSVVTFALDHLLALTAAGGLGLIAAAVLLAIFLPATMPLIRTAFDVALKGLAWLIGTVAGRVIIAIIIAFLAGFWTRGAFDRTAELQRQIEAQREATAAAQAEVAQARQEAAALDQVNDAAARRAEAAEADASDYAEQAADLEDKIEAESKSATPAKPAHPCPLSAANVRDFLLIGAPRATKP